MSSKISDLSNKITFVIGDLLSKAENVSKSILQAFDSSKDMHANSKVLSSSRFSKQDLIECAQFFKIETEDQDGKPIFNNKPSLANRIILEIHSLYPAVCGACDDEYSIKFDPESEPAVRCFLCFQGCHDCDQFSKPTIDSSQYLPGTVWLCRSCHEINNPVKPSKSSSSKPVSRNQSKSNTPVHTPLRTDNQDSQANLDSKELVTRLNELKKEQVHNENNSNISKQNFKPEDICESFKIGKCPHGVSGKTAAKGRPSCSKIHPKRCNKFIKYGKKNRYGCRRKDCKFFHPEHCPSSLSQRCCYSEDCTLVHLAGTKRHKPPEQESYRRQDDRNKNDRSSRFKSDTQKTRSRTTSVNQPTANPPQRSADFLELRSLLMTVKETLQKDIVGLQSSIAEQEIKMNSLRLAPSLHPQSYPPPPLHPFHQSLQHQHPSLVPQPHQFLQQSHPAPPPQILKQNHPLPPPQMTWQNTQVSGC